MFVQDDFCRDSALLEALNDAAVWEAAVGKFNWWSGWQSQQPVDIWQQVIKGIWGGHEIVKSIAGFEYWVNVLNADSQKTNHLGWHVDKDEALHKRTGKTVCPIIGSVFYGFPHQLDGGFLENSLETTFTDVERIAPVYNRLIIFNVANQHRVSRVYKGTRYSFQVNLWKALPETFNNGA